LPRHCRHYAARFIPADDTTADAVRRHAILLAIAAAWGRHTCHAAAAAEVCATPPRLRPYAIEESQYARPLERHAADGLGHAARQ